MRNIKFEVPVEIVADLGKLIEKRGKKLTLKELAEFSLIHGYDLSINNTPKPKEK